MGEVGIIIILIFGVKPDAWGRGENFDRHRLKGSAFRPQELAILEPYKVC